MTEQLLQFIWLHQYFDATRLQTRTGEPIEIIHPGLWNHDQGPDFLQARVRIGGTVWAGAIEIHLRSGDWDLHQHQRDPRYQQVVLHVVWEHDKDASIPCSELELQGRISRMMLDQYASWMSGYQQLPCAGQFHQVPDVIWLGWQDRLLVERLELRSKRMTESASSIQFHWQQLAWQELARAYGGRLNGAAFELMARSIPIRILFRELHHPARLEAILFGQLGLLEEQQDESYPQLLAHEYALLRHKYGLEPVFVKLSRLRMRPQDFPELRVAQLAALLLQGESVISELLDGIDFHAWMRRMQMPANDYWHYHYRFGHISRCLPKVAGKQLVQRVLLNAVFPLRLAYAQWTGKPVLPAEVMDWYTTLEAEPLARIRPFDAHPHMARHAGDTQARLQLLDHYCIPKKCLQCAVGSWLLKPIGKPGLQPVPDASSA